MAKHLLWFKPLKGLLLAVCLSILAILPAAAAEPPAAETTQPSPDDIKVLQPSITVPAGLWIYLSDLINSDIVEGIDVNSWKDYTVASSETRNVSINSNINYPCVWFSSSVTTTLTYTHKEFPEVKFSIEVTAKNSPASYLNSNLSSVYMDASRVITIPDDYMPMSEFTIEKVAPSNNSPGEVNVEVDGNTITVEGVKEGTALYTLTYNKLNISTTRSIEVTAKPSAESIRVLEESITVPTLFSMRLYNLINSGVVEGIPANNWQDYSVESSETNNVSISTNGYFSFYSPLITTLTFTNKEFPDAKFSIEVTAENSVVSYLNSNLRSVYIDVPQTLTLPDDYMPMSEFTIEKVAPSDNYPGDLDIEVTDNTITVNGVKEGLALYRLTYNKFNLYTSRSVEIAAKPSTETIKVLEESITVPTRLSFSLSHLINNNIVEGIPANSWQDYSVESSESQNVTVQTNGYVRFTAPLTTTLTFTNKEFPEAQFSIEVNAKNSVVSYLSSNLQSAYLGVSRTFTIPDDYMPLSDFTINGMAPSNNFPGEVKVEIDGKTITVEGIKEGRALYELTYNKLKLYTNTSVEVTAKPSAESIKVLEESITVPVQYSFSLYTLINKSIVEGIPANSWQEYDVESSETKNVNIQTNGSVYFSAPVNTTLTYSLKGLPEVKFSIDVTAMLNPYYYINTELRTTYVGVARTITLPDGYMPLSEYTVDKVAPSGNYTGDFNLKVDGNTITVEGVEEGRAILRLTNNLLGFYSNMVINILPKSTVEKEPVVNENGEGELLSNLNTKVLIVVPADISAAAGDSPLIWKSSNEDIATIDEDGLVNPLSLGRTIITASIENTASRSDETVLMSIEFWVVELVADVPAILTVDSSAQASYKVDAGADEYTKSINAEWASMNPSIVEIDSDGNMTAVSEGQATIALTTDIGRKTATVTVVAENDQPKTISISPADVGITVGNKLKLSAQGANGREVLWTTSNSFAVQVDGEGWLTAIAPGSATVTATIAGTSISASVYVTVFERTTGIEGTETSEPRIAVEGNTVTVGGIAADVTVEVYNMAGSRIASRKGSCAIAIDNGGIYLVRIGRMVRKVAVKR